MNSPLEGLRKFSALPGKFCIRISICWSKMQKGKKNRQKFWSRGNKGQTKRCFVVRKCFQQKFKNRQGKHKKSKGKKRRRRKKSKILSNQKTQKHPLKTRFLPDIIDSQTWKAGKLNFPIEWSDFGRKRGGESQQMQGQILGQTAMSCRPSIPNHTKIFSWQWA